MKRLLSIVVVLVVLSGYAKAGLFNVLGSEPEEYSLKEMKYFNWTSLQIIESYVDQKRVNAFDMFKAALRGIEKAVPELLIKFNEDTLNLEVKMGDKVASRRLERKPGVLWENTILLQWVFSFVDDNIRDRKKLFEVEFSAINEMLSELDPHSNFMNASQCNELKISTAGKFGGLGIIIQSKGGYITVVSPIKGTPAYRAGIKSGDKIVRIDDESAINMNLDQAVNRLRGEPGTKVTIYVLRESWSEPRKFVLTREEIKTRSVEKLLLSDEGKKHNVAYIKLNGFSDETYEDVKKAFRDLKDEAKGRLDGVILDLRDNPGGLLDASVKVSDMFLRKGVIVSTQAKDGEKVEEKVASDSEGDIDLPMVVLINRGSASASEIVAGALKDNNRAVIIGQTSFGKGSVQILYDRPASRDEVESLKDYKLSGPLKDCLKLTIAEYMTPRNVSIQSIGITPDIYLVPQLVQKYSMNMYYFPRYSSEVKLEKHLESSRPPEDKPFVVLPYVYEKDKDGDDSDDSDDPYSQDIKEDFEMRFAKELLINAKSNNRMEIIEAAKRLKETYFKTESSKFAEILKNRGIDFSEGESGSLDVDLSVSYKKIVYRNGEKKDSSKKEEKIIEKTVKIDGDELRAGDDYFLSMRVTNKSSKPIYRLSGIIESQDPVLNGKEMFWGRLNPNESKEYDVLVKLSKTFPKVIIPYRIRFLINGKYQDKEFVKNLKVINLPEPHYVLSYEIMDKGEHSNNNQKIEKGETVTIRTEVVNMGEGEGFNPRVALQNQSGKSVYLKNGMCSYKSLKPSEKQTCELQFAVRDKTGEPDLKLKLYVSDDFFYEDASTVLKLPFMKSLGEVSSGKVNLPIIKVVSAPELEIVNGKSAQIVFSVYNLKGREDIYVKANDSKAYYMRNSENKSTIENIKADVPLKEGFNNIYIFVRVNEEQYAYKRVVITTPKKFEQNDIIATQNN
jgi:carboxyl-terminal processing protease